MDTVVSPDSPSASGTVKTSGIKTDFGIILLVFLIGLATWISTGFYLATRQPVSDLSASEVLFDGLSSYWQQGYCYSLIVVFVLLVVFAIVRKWSASRVVRGIIYYGVSPLLFLALLKVFKWIYFSELVENEAIQFYGSAVVIFYLLGVVFGLACIAAKRRDALEIFLLLPLIGTLLLVGYTGYNLFTGTDFVYRNAFTLNVESLTIGNDGIDLKGTLDVHKKGDYIFSSSYINPYIMDPGAKNDTTIEWGAGTPSDKGKYPLHIAVRNIQSNSPSRVVLENTRGLYFQISRAATDKNPVQYIRSIPISLDKNRKEVVAPSDSMPSSGAN